MLAGGLMLRIAVAARLEEWPRLLDALELFAERNGLDPRVAHRLALVVEELFVNLSTHGSPPAPADPPRFELEALAEGGRVRVELRDTGAPFDPWGRTVETHAPADQRPVGGLGLHLSERVVASREYQRVGNLNVSRFVLEVEAGDAAAGP